MTGNQHLFVYGTLRRDSRHEMYRLLARNADFVGDAVFRGRLYLIDDYPGAVPSASPDDIVKGELYLLERPDQVLPKLDDYEEFDSARPQASLYRRELRDVRLENGSVRKAWIYLFNKPTVGLALIPSGDFLEGNSRTEQLLAADEG
jgi:gamma-glutamylcyclotransferase (GGCT)/AIG2-like uncharacterized protein YtfP